MHINRQNKPKILLMYVVAARKGCWRVKHICLLFKAYVNHIDHKEGFLYFEQEVKNFALLTRYFMYCVKNYLPPSNYFCQPIPQKILPPYPQNFFVTPLPKIILPPYPQNFFYQPSLKFFATPSPKKFCLSNPKYVLLHHSPKKITIPHLIFLETNPPIKLFAIPPSNNFPTP